MDEKQEYWRRSLMVLNGDAEDRWVSSVRDCIASDEEPSSHFWLMDLEVSFPFITRLLEKVGKFDGAVFGGFLRDFLRPLCVLHSAMDHLQAPLQHTYDVWCVVLGYLFSPGSLCFKDIDIWFTTKQQYIRFIGELRSEQNVEADRLDLWKVCQPDTPIGDDRDRREPDRSYPAIKDSWLLKPFHCENYVDPSRERVLELGLHKLKIDCVLSEYLPVNNFACNLLFLRPGTGEWKVGKPFSFAPRILAREIRNNSFLQTSESDVLTYIDCKTTTLLPDYAVFLSDAKSFRKVSNPPMIQEQVSQYEVLPTPNRLGFHEGWAWPEIIKVKLERLVKDLHFTIIYPPPPFRYFPPQKRRRL